MLLLYYCRFGGGATSATGTGLKNTIMQFWAKQRPKLIHDYSLVGYILSPNPRIMEDAITNKAQIHNNAPERLITKLLLDLALVGIERTV